LISIVPLRALVALVYMAGVLGLSALPGRQIARFGLTAHLIDLAHIPLFAGLTLVTLWAVVGPRALRTALVASAILAFAAIDEGLQRWVPGRVTSLADLGRDAAGIALGIAISEALRPIALAWRRESEQ
jgi:VanZ family protein